MPLSSSRLPRWNLLILSCFFLSWTASQARSQKKVVPTFRIEGKSQFPDFATGINALGIGDFDRDGDLDVFGSNPGGTSWTYFNDGRGDFHLICPTLRACPTVQGGLLTQAVLVVDINGDKNLDLILATASNGFTANGQTRLLLGDGQGGFRDVTASNMPVDKDDTMDLALGDVDGDGDLDLVLANGSLDDKSAAHPRQTRLYLNNGKGVFTDVTLSNMPVDADFSQAVFLGDLDGDGDLDIVLGNGHPWLRAKGQKNKVYINDGKGKFVDASKSWGLGRSEVSNDLLLIDLDGDGDLDLLEANGDMTQGAQNRVYLNQGKTQGFRELYGAIPQESSFSTTLAVADLDSDGKLDLYVGNFRSPDRILLGNGRGAFTKPAKPLIIEDGYATMSVKIADLDADGNLDIICGNRGEGIRLILGLGKGEFLETSTGRLFPSRKPGIRASALADLNGDGHVDRVEAVIGYPSAQNGLWFGNGQGSFENRTASHFPKDSDSSFDVALGDIDGDGDIDIAFANYGQNTLYLNDGTGRFQDITFTNLPRDNANSTALAFADIDGDKDLDLLIANVNAPNLLLLNNGKGKFTRAQTTAFPKDTDETRDLKLADLDGDGDLDLILVNGIHRLTGSTGQQNRIYKNDGKGRFIDITASALPKLADSSSSVDAADVDGDGDLDIFVGNTDWNFVGGKQNRLLLNDGKGRFTDASTSRIPLDLDATWACQFADFDMDGDPDLLMWNFSIKNMVKPIARSYLENDGKGFFTDKTSLRFGAFFLANPFPLPVAVDLDRDGDLDIVLGRINFKNRFRQIHAPVLARIGQSYVVEFFAETGSGNKARLAFPLLSLAKLPRPIPLPTLGWLALNPGQIIVDSAFLIPNDGAVFYRLPLPRQLFLVGLTLHTQGLILHGPSFSSARLTNWISDRILR